MKSTGRSSGPTISLSQPESDSSSVARLYGTKRRANPMVSTLALSGSMNFSSRWICAPLTRFAVLALERLAHARSISLLTLLLHQNTPVGYCP